jgi:hypothetical protein
MGNASCCNHTPDQDMSQNPFNKDFTETDQSQFSEASQLGRKIPFEQAFGDSL